MTKITLEPSNWKNWILMISHYRNMNVYSLWQRMIGFESVGWKFLQHGTLIWSPLWLCMVLWYYFDCVLHTVLLWLCIKFSMVLLWLYIILWMVLLWYVLDFGWYYLGYLQFGIWMLYTWKKKKKKNNEMYYLGKEKSENKKYIINFLHYNFKKKK